MPRVERPISKGKPKSSLGQYLAAGKRTGTDAIEIGSALPVPRGKELKSATMADAAKVVAGILYLLRQWIAFGMLTGVIAEPGIGKSAFVLFALVRVVVTGCDWFNGMKGPIEPGDVLWCPTENDMAITIERMKNWGIPMERIRLPFADDPLAAVNLTNGKHLERIELLINHHQIKLVVIDSLRGGHGDDENNSRVGRVLQALASIAERTNAAIVVVHHTKKLMVDEEITANSSRGSNAILAMMRSQIGIDRPDPKSKWCRVRVLKENLGIAPQPVGFLVTENGLKFGPAPEKPRKQTQKDDAEEWLRDRMKPGKAYVASEILAEAMQHGHCERTVRKAAIERLQIKPKPVRKDGKIAEWEWRLP